MGFSLYEAVIPTYQQILHATEKLLDKAEQWRSETQTSEWDVIDARIAPDMFPFGYQIKSLAVHSIGAIEGVRRGQFAPDMTPWPETMDGLKARVSQTAQALDELTPEEVNGFLGQEMCFLFKDHRMEFKSAEAFLMSFSLPNFMFHATTAYDILRMKGLTIGKRDFLGKMALKG